MLRSREVLMQEHMRVNSPQIDRQRTIYRAKLLSLAWFYEIVTVFFFLTHFSLSSSSSLFLFAVWVIETRPLCMVNRHSTTEIYPHLHRITLTTTPYFGNPELQEGLSQSLLRIAPWRPHLLKVPSPLSIIIWNPKFIPHDPKGHTQPYSNHIRSAQWLKGWLDS